MIAIGGTLGVEVGFRACFPSWHTEIYGTCPTKEARLSFHKELTATFTVSTELLNS